MALEILRIFLHPSPLTKCGAIFKKYSAGYQLVNLQNSGSYEYYEIMGTLSQKSLNQRQFSYTL